MLVLFAFFCNKNLHAEKQNSHQNLQTGIVINLGEHILCCKGRNGILEIEDGTQMMVHPDQVEIILNDWEYYDSLKIFPNNNILNGSDYCVENLNTGDIVQVTFRNGPLLKSPYTMKIVYVDPNEGRISLCQEIEDGAHLTHWEIDPNDLQHISDWEKGETVVLGNNTSWFSNFDFIMVSYENLKSTNYIKAKKLDDWR